MKIENQSTAQITYNKEKQKVKQHEGHLYIKIGKSYKGPSSGDRLVCIAALIGLVSAGIFFFFIPFAFKEYRQLLYRLKVEILSEREKIIHYVPKPEEWNDHLHFLEHNMGPELVEKEDQLDLDERLPFLEDLILGLKDSFLIFLLTNIQIYSAKCLIKIDCKEGAIRKEFILKNEEELPFTLDLFSQQIDKIRQLLENEIKESLEEYKKFQWIILFRDDQGVYHKQEGKKEETGAIGYKWEEKNNSGKLQMESKDREVTNREIVDQMGFTQEGWNGEFIPGRFYQELI